MSFRTLWVTALLALLLTAVRPWVFLPARENPAPPLRVADALPNIVLVLADDLDVRLNTLEYTPYIRDLLQH